MKLIILTATTALIFPSGLQAAPAPHPAEPPSLNGASVTIPYSELRALWQQAHRDPAGAPSPKPLVPFLVNEANAVLQLGPETSVLEVKYLVETFGPEWSSVPLIGGDARLEKAETGPGGAVIWRDGYRLLTRQPGRTPVMLRLSLPGWKAAAAGRAISFSLGDAAVKRLRIAGVPAELRAMLNGQPISAAAAKAGATAGAATNSISLGGEANAVTLSLAAPEPERREQPSQWRMEAQVLARQEEGRMQLRSKLFAHAESGSGLELSLRLPANASNVEVSGEDVADWSQARPNERERRVRVRFKTWDILDRELRVTFHVPVSPLAEQWTLPAPASTDAGEMRALYVIALADGLELKAPELREGVEAQRLPAWMREEIGGAPVATAEAGAELTVRPRWLPAVATSEATISAARSELRYVADGSFQTTASFTIRHQAPLAWPLELPAGVELLSCNIGGQSARPVRRDNGTLELSLPSGGAGDGPTATEVTLVYTGKQAALDPVSGKLPLELARTPLFIERLEWTISIPETFEITAAEGNARIAARGASASNAPNCIALSKDLCRGERPSIELFYQRRGLDQ